MAQIQFFQQSHLLVGAPEFEQIQVSQLQEILEVQEVVVHPELLDQVEQEILRQYLPHKEMMVDLDLELVHLQMAAVAAPVNLEEVVPARNRVPVEMEPYLLFPEHQ
jgi:hypothetical protein